MSILATDKKLISFGTDYSAGSGISIIDHTISVTGEFGKTYSAGDNTNIYEQDGNYYISGKDWSNEISDASANSYTQSTSYFNNWINGQYTGDITNITNNLTSLSGDLSSYYKKTETSSKEQISDAIQYVSAHAVGDVEVNNYVHNNSATIDEVNSAYKANSASYITAHQSLEGYATEDWVTAQGYITGVNIPESAVWNETSNVVSSNSAKWSEGKTYAGVLPIVVNNNENKISADTWTLSAGDGISFTENSANKVTRIDVTAQGGVTLTGDAQGAVDLVYSTSGNIITGTKRDYDFTAGNVTGLTLGNVTFNGADNSIIADRPGMPNKNWYISYGGFHLGPDFKDGYWEQYARVYLERTGLSSMSGSSSDKKLIWRALLDTDVEGANNTITAIAGSAIGGLTGEFVPQSAFDELKQSYDALSSLFATYSGQWLLPNEGV